VVIQKKARRELPGHITGRVGGGIKGDKYDGKRLGGSKGGELADCALTKNPAKKVFFLASKKKIRKEGV